MTRRVTRFWFAPAGRGGTQMIRLDCGHERPIPGAATDAEAQRRAQFTKGLVTDWYEDCPHCPNPNPLT